MTKEEITKLQEALAVVRDLLPKAYDAIDGLSCGDKKDDLFDTFEKGGASTRLQNIIKYNFYLGKKDLYFSEWYKDSDRSLQKFASMFSKKDILKLRKCGKKVVSEIEEILMKEGIAWR